MKSPALAKKIPSRVDRWSRARLNKAVGTAGPRPGHGSSQGGMPRGLFAEKPTMVGGSTTAAAGPSKALPSPPSAAIIALTRLGFGPSPSALADFQALGATDAQRFQAYIDQQLNPAGIDDSAADARVAQSGFETLGKNVLQLWTEHLMSADWEIVMQPLWETTQATWLRAVHSKRQLFELMTDFWHNHFNVYADDVPFGPVWVHTDRDAIRAHALGNFREMVEAVTRTPAMLFYLDNAFNSAEDANENYARELLELHILGSEAYYGSIDPANVPTDGNGVPMGYTEADVIEVARCLTGWTVNSDWVHWEFGQTGEFMYHAPWHDTDAKQVVGLQIPADQGDQQDARDMLDWLCAHPATARFVAGKICRRVMADFPPLEVLDAAAATFLANVDAPDQIAQTLRTILEHPLFLQTWADKVKRPFEIAASMLRGASFDLPFVLGNDNAANLTGWFLWEYYQTGQPLFGWHPPNGYPDSKFAWNTTSPRVMTWRIANMLVSIWDEQADDYYFDLLSRTPASSRTAEEIVDFWSVEILGRGLPAAERGPLVSFMAQDTPADEDLPLGSDWQVDERLRALVALILMCPTFLWK